MIRNDIFGTVNVYSRSGFVPLSSGRTNAVGEIQKKYLEAFSKIYSKENIHLIYNSFWIKLLQEEESSDFSAKLKCSLDI